LFESVQRGIKRPLVDLQDVVRNAPNPLRDGPTVHRLEGDGLEDEQIESALHEISRFGQENLPLVTDMNYASTPVNKLGEGKVPRGVARPADASRSKVQTEPESMQENETKKGNRSSIG